MAVVVVPALPATAIVLVPPVPPVPPLPPLPGFVPEPLAPPAPTLFPVAAGQTMIRANGSLGWVFPGALGAAIGAPDRRVVAITGDGGMLYHMSEFETALRCNIPAVVIVLNNACLASEYQTQKRHQRVVKSVLDFRDVDFAAVARSFGAFGVRVTKVGELNAAIAAALANGGPALVDVVVSREAQSPSANRDKTRLV